MTNQSTIDKLTTICGQVAESLRRVPVRHDWEVISPKSKCGSVILPKCNFDVLQATPIKVS